MNEEEALAIANTVSGYWSTPVIEPQEVQAWVIELIGSDISFEEAWNVIRVESGREFRPRPGQFVQLAKHYRRQEALRRPRKALDEGGRTCSTEENLANLDQLRSQLNRGTDQGVEDAPDG